MSSHSCPVIKVKLEPHPNADSLALVKYGGFTLVVKKDEWRDDDLAVHIEEDYVVPKTEVFSFLGDKTRIKPRKFRGIYSDGILIKAPDGSKEGDNLIDFFGIKRYDPAVEISFRGDNESGPGGNWPKYDVEGFKKYSDWFVSGEEIIATEKIHGASARYLWQDGRMFVGSRTNWKTESEKDPWWRALKQCPWIEKWCKEHEGYALYGEIYGAVQKFRYGHLNGEISLRVFDIRKGREWLSHDEARELGKDLFWVPIIYRGPLSVDQLLELIEKDSIIGGTGHIMEGCVISPVMERETPEGDRVKLKLVSKRYMEKS